MALYIHRNKKGEEKFFKVGLIVNTFQGNGLPNPKSTEWASSGWNLKAVSWIIPSCWGRLFFLFVCFSTQAFNWLDKAHPHEGGNLHYLKFIELNVNLIQKHTLTETPRIMFAQISGHPLAHLSWHIKLTIRVAVKCELAKRLWIERYLRPRAKRGPLVRLEFEKKDILLNQLSVNYQEHKDSTKYLF